MEPFKPDLITEAVLHRLLKQNIVFTLHVGTDLSAESNYLYRAGRPCDYFVFLLQGRCLVELGREGLVFEAGPFMYFGVQALLGEGGGGACGAGKP